MTAAAAAVNDLSVCGIATDQLAPFSNEPCAWSSNIESTVFMGGPRLLTNTTTNIKYGSNYKRGLKQSSGSLWAAREDETNTKAQH